MHKCVSYPCVGSVCNELPHSNSVGAGDLQHRLKQKSNKSDVA